MMSIDNTNVTLIYHSEQIDEEGGDRGMAKGRHSTSQHQKVDQVISAHKRIQYVLNELRG